jgi:hypothetical protein
MQIDELRAGVERILKKLSEQRDDPERAMHLRGAEEALDRQPEARKRFFEALERFETRMR